nr:hypothetical protein [uncultured Treponema sp.]
MKKIVNTVHELETPCFIIDEERLRNNYDSLNKAFCSSWGRNFQIGYSFKTNSFPWILLWMREHGVYAEVVSETEALLAEKMGFSYDKMIINGPYKGFSAMEKILNVGGVVNLDSFHEIKWLEENKPRNRDYWKVGLRINFDLEYYCPKETIVGSNFSRFGFNLENGAFQEAVDRLKKIPYVKIVGLHNHNSTKTKSLSVFKIAAQKIIEASRFLDNADIEYIDMGGALWGDKPNAPSFQDYAACIVDELKKVFNSEKIMLFLEPGASLIASPICYLCKVIDIKNVNMVKFITTNGSLIHIAPQMHGITFKPDIISAFPNSKILCDKQVVVGFTCIENDRMSMLEDYSELQIDDLLVFNNVGSYSMALSPLFIQYFPNVYIKTCDNKLLLAREAWTVNEYLQKGCFEWQN